MRKSKVPLRGNPQRLEQYAMLVFPVAWKALMLLLKAMLPMDLYAASVNKHSILLVCFGLKKTSIAKNVTKNMWCQSVKQRPFLKNCYKVKRGQIHELALQTLKMISSSMWITF
jgi:hypothetical protein